MGWRSILRDEGQSETPVPAPREQLPPGVPAWVAKPPPPGRAREQPQKGSRGRTSIELLLGVSDTVSLSASPSFGFALVWRARSASRNAHVLLGVSETTSPVALAWHHGTARQLSCCSTSTCLGTLGPCAQPLGFALVWRARSASRNMSFFSA